MIVVLAAAAATDLEEIADYIARDNPARAASFVAELIERCDRLAATPLGFPLVPRYRDRGIRRRVHGRYLIFYRVERDRIVVLYVLDGARDYDPILFPEG